jgi:hypothetical protein
MVERSWLAFLLNGWGGYVAFTEGDVMVTDFTGCGDALQLGFLEVGY